MKGSHLLVITAVLALLQGCAAVVVAGGATAVSAATDRRTIGSQIDDNSIAIKARRALSEDRLTNEGPNINVTSYNGVVLLTGQAPSDQVIQRAGQLIKDIQGVRDVHNQIRLGSNTSLTTRTQDSWISTRVKTQLLAADDISGQNIRVITENAEVFLMGLVEVTEGDKAVEIARHVSGVSRVIKAFESR